MSVRFLTSREVAQRVALSRTEIYRRIAAGTFPEQVPLGTQRVGLAFYLLHLGERAAKTRPWLGKLGERAYEALWVLLLLGALVGCVMHYHPHSSRCIDMDDCAPDADSIGD